MIPIVKREPASIVRRAPPTVSPSLVFSHPKACKTVSFFVSFHQGATQAGRLSDMRQPGGAPCPVLAPLAVARVGVSDRRARLPGLRFLDRLTRKKPNRSSTAAGSGSGGRRTGGGGAASTGRSGGGSTRRSSGGRCTGDAAGRSSRSSGGSRRCSSWTNVSGMPGWTTTGR